MQLQVLPSFNAAPPPLVILSAAEIQANYGTALNVLPPTPAVAPQPQPAPPPQEEQQEEQQVEEEATEEEGEEEVAEEAAPEEGEGEGEEELAEGEEGPPEGELAEGEEGPPVGPDGEPLAEGEEGPPEGEGGPPEGEVALGPDGEPLPPGEGGPPEGEAPASDEQVAAREAFDTAMAAGATPEQAMAEAAEAGGFNQSISNGPDGLAPPTSGPMDSPMNAPLGNMGMPMPGGMNPFNANPILNAGPVDPMGGPIMGPAFGPGPMMGPAFGPGPMMGPAFGPGSMDMLAGPMSPGDNLPGAVGFGDPLGGPGGGFGPYSNTPEAGPVESYFFDDPSLYDDYVPNTPVPLAEESGGGSGSSATQTETGTSGSDSISKLNSSNPWVLDGLDGSDTLIGGNQNDIIIGGLGADTMTGGLGDDKFYYKQGHADANIFDKITDFRQSGAGNDQMIAGVTQTTSYTRIPIYNDAASGGSMYRFNDHSNQLPTIFNFTHNTNTSHINTASSVSSYLDPGFWVTPDGNTWTSSLAEQFILVFGDGNDTYTWLWEDTSKGGAPDAAELFPIAILPGFDNDTLNGTEFDYQILSGV